jgi:hypothetical protein
VVLERAPTVGLLLEDHVIDEAAGLHATEGQQAIRPAIGRLAYEFADSRLSVLSRLGPALKEGVRHPARIAIGRGEV